jgi:hypothetical protein
MAKKVHFLEKWLNLPVQSTNKSFEMPGNLGQYSHEDFFGLFWGEQQPFVSSGYGGLYFFRDMASDRSPGALPRLRDRLCWGEAPLRPEV